jgi:hypothetical protein
VLVQIGADGREGFSYGLRVVIKLIVPERNELNKFSFRTRPKNGFAYFMTALKYRMAGSTGELDLDNEDINRLGHYAKRGYKKRILRMFGRTLSQRLN